MHFGQRETRERKHIIIHDARTRGEALKSLTTRLKSITVINVRFVPLECGLECSYCTRQETPVRTYSVSVYTVRHIDLTVKNTVEEALLISSAVYS